MTFADLDGRSCCRLKQQGSVQVSTGTVVASGGHLESRSVERIGSTAEQLLLQVGRLRIQCGRPLGRRLQLLLLGGELRLKLRLLLRGGLHLRCQLLALAREAEPLQALRLQLSAQLQQLLSQLPTCTKPLTRNAPARQESNIFW